MDLKRVRPDEPVTAAWANALIDALVPLTRWTASFPLEIRSGPSGYGLHLARETKIEVFELAEDLVSGSTASANILWHNGDDWTTADTRSITVADPLGTFEGVTGDRGIAMFHNQSGLWIVLQLQC